MLCIGGGNAYDTTFAGAFAATLDSDYDYFIGFRCAFTPNTVNLIYSASGAKSGQTPNDQGTYVVGSLVTIKNNTNLLMRTGYAFAGWNTAANGTGTNYAPGSTLTISVNTTLYANWIDCSGMAGGSWVAVPGDRIYGTRSFCVQKYAPSDVGSAPTSQTGTLPWVSITQASAVTTCASLGGDFHLITNPQWMTVAANMANVGSNWSGGIVGSGNMRRGHSDNSPASACAANATEANAYVETDCSGNTIGTFSERRTGNLSTGGVVWDIGGNVFNWVNYNNANDKPTIATAIWREHTAVTGSGTTPKAHIVPINNVQPWWTNSWTSAQGVGGVLLGANGAGGALARGADWSTTINAGLFSLSLDSDGSTTNANIGFRCAYVPTTFRVNYDPNDATTGTSPVESIRYALGATATVLGNSGSLDRYCKYFNGWNTSTDGTGTDYAPSDTFTISVNTTLFAKWGDACG